MILDKNSVVQFSDWYSSLSERGGAILVNKDLGWTSFDVVAKIRNLLQIKKVGHAGTLDPLASGLLILCLGPFTKRIVEFQDLKKTYIAKIRIGATTKTADSEMDEENITDISDLTNDKIIQVCENFVGDISQIPPMFSAKKVKGKRLYKMARMGMDIELEPSLVKIYSLTVRSIELPFVEIEVECSKGTYIRALARDIGEELGKGAYLAALERTAIGDYNVNTALSVQEINKIIVESKQTTTKEIQ